MPRQDRPPKPLKDTGPPYAWDDTLPEAARPAVLWEYAARPLWVQALPEPQAILLMEKEQVLLRDAVSGGERWRLTAKELPDEVRTDAGGLYLAAGRDSRCLDPASGETRWRQTQGGVITGITSEPDHVYLSTKGPLLALDPTDGTVQWRTPCAWEPALYPCPADGVLLVDNPETDTVVCLDSRTGERRWEFASEGQPVTVGAVVDGSVILSCHGHGAACVALETGEVRWRLQTGGVFEAPAVVLGGRAYLTDGRALAVDPTTGEVLWTRALAEEPDRVFVMREAGNLILAETWRGRLVALDPADGKFRWEHSLGQLHGVTRGPRHLYARFCREGEVKGWSAYALDPATGAPVWALHSEKIIADLTVLAGVLAVELRNRVAVLDLRIA